MNHQNYNDLATRVAMPYYCIKIGIGVPHAVVLVRDTISDRWATFGIDAHLLIRVLQEAHLTTSGLQGVEPLGDVAFATGANGKDLTKSLAGLCYEMTTFPHEMFEAVVQSLNSAGLRVCYPGTDKFLTHRIPQRV